jgi:hypothetical protein
MSDSAHPLLSIEAILSALDPDPEAAALPREALEAAIACQDAITPYLLEWLRQASTGADELGDTWLRTTIAMYLLAQFREPQAFPLILELMTLPEEPRESLWGDALTEDGPRLLISTYHGDWDALVDLADDPTQYEYSRSTACGAMAGIWLEGQVSRAQLIDTWRGLLQRWSEDVENQDENEVPLSFLVSEAVDVQAVELAEELKTATASPAYDPMLMRPEDVAKELATPNPDHLNAHRRARQPITEAVAELAAWDMFLTPAEREAKEADQQEQLQLLREKLYAENPELAERIFGTRLSDFNMPRPKSKAGKQKKSKRKQQSKSRKKNRRK